jgi:hypothetical protein
MIEKLTKEQEEALPLFRDKWIKIGLGTGPVDWDKAREAVKAAYKVGGLEPPEEIIIVKGGPLTLVEAYIEKYYGKGGKTIMEAWTEIEGGMCYGIQDAGWLSFYDVFLSGGTMESGAKPLVEGVEALKPLMDLAYSGCGWWLPLDKAAFLSEPPVELHLDKEGRLHRDGGMALKYSDGDGIYAIHGEVMPMALVEGKASGMTLEARRAALAL